VDELSKERSAKLVKTRAYMPARYAHVTLARDHVQLRSANHQNHSFQHGKACPTIIISLNYNNNYKKIKKINKKAFSFFKILIKRFSFKNRVYILFNLF